MISDWDPNTNRKKARRPKFYKEPVEPEPPEEIETCDECWGAHEVSLIKDGVCKDCRRRNR